MSSSTLSEMKSVSWSLAFSLSLMFSYSKAPSLCWLSSSKQVFTFLSHLIDSSYCFLRRMQKECTGIPLSFTTEEYSCMEGSSGNLASQQASPRNFLRCLSISSQVLAGASPMMMIWSIFSQSSCLPMSQKSTSCASLPSPPSGLMEVMKALRQAGSLEKLDCSRTFSRLVLQLRQIMILCSKDTWGIRMLMISSVREMVSLRMLSTAFKAAPIDPVPSIAITVLIVSPLISLQFSFITAPTSFEFSLAMLPTTSKVPSCSCRADSIAFDSSFPCLRSCAFQLSLSAAKRSLSATSAMSFLRRSSSVTATSKDPFLPWRPVRPRIWMKSDSFLERQVWMTCMPPRSLRSLSQTVKSVPREKAELMRVMRFLVPAQLISGLRISGGIFSVILQMLEVNWLNSGELETRLSCSSVSKKTRMGRCDRRTSWMRASRQARQSSLAQEWKPTIWRCESPQMEGRAQMSAILQSSRMMRLRKSDMASTVPETPMMWSKYLGSSAQENWPTMRLMLMFLLQLASLILPRSYSQQEAKAVLQPKLSLLFTLSLSTYWISLFLISQGCTLQLLTACTIDSTWFFSSSASCGKAAVSARYSSDCNASRLSRLSEWLSQMKRTIRFTSPASIAIPGAQICPKQCSSKKTSTSSITRIRFTLFSRFSSRFSRSRQSSWPADSCSLSSTFFVTSLKLNLLPSLNTDSQCSEKGPQLIILSTPKRTNSAWNSSSSRCDRQDEQQPQYTSNPHSARQQLSPASTRDLPSPVLTSIRRLPSSALCPFCASTSRRMATTWAMCGLPSKLISSCRASMLRQIAQTAKILAITTEGGSSLACDLVSLMSCSTRFSDLDSQYSFSTRCSSVLYCWKAAARLWARGALSAVCGHLLMIWWMSFMAWVLSWNCSSLICLKRLRAPMPRIMSLFLDFLAQLMKMFLRPLSNLSISACTLALTFLHTSSISASKFDSTFFTIRKESKNLVMMLSHLWPNLPLKASIFDASCFSSCSSSDRAWLVSVLISASIFCSRTASSLISWKEFWTSAISLSYFWLILAFSASMKCFFFSSSFFSESRKDSYSFSRACRQRSTLASRAISSSITMRLKSYSSFMISLKHSRFSFFTISFWCRIILYFSTMSSCGDVNNSAMSFFSTAYSLLQLISMMETRSLWLMAVRRSASRQPALRQSSNLKRRYLMSLKTSTRRWTFLRCSKRKWLLSYCSLSSSLQKRNCLTYSYTLSMRAFTFSTIYSYFPRWLQYSCCGQYSCHRFITRPYTSIFISSTNNFFRLHFSSKIRSCSKCRQRLRQFPVTPSLIASISCPSFCLSLSSSRLLASLALKIEQSLMALTSPSVALPRSTSLSPSKRSMAAMLALREESSGLQKQILCSLLLKMSRTLRAEPARVRLQRPARKRDFLSMSLAMLSQEQFMQSSRMLTQSLRNLELLASFFWHSLRKSPRFSKSSSFSLRFSLLMILCRSSSTLFLWIVTTSRQYAISLFCSLLRKNISRRSVWLFTSPSSHSFVSSCPTDSITALCSFACTLLPSTRGRKLTMLVQYSKCSSRSASSGVLRTSLRMSWFLMLSLRRAAKTHSLPSSGCGRNEYLRGSIRLFNSPCSSWKFFCMNSQNQQKCLMLLLVSSISFSSVLLPQHYLNLSSRQSTMTAILAASSLICSCISGSWSMVFMVLRWLASAKQASNCARCLSAMRVLPFSLLRVAFLACRVFLSLQMQRMRTDSSKAMLENYLSKSQVAMRSSVMSTSHRLIFSSLRIFRKLTILLYSSEKLKLQQLFSSLLRMSSNTFSFLKIFWQRQQSKQTRVTISPSSLPFRLFLFWFRISSSAPFTSSTFTPSASSSHRVYFWQAFPWSTTCMNRFSCSALPRYSSNFSAGRFYLISPQVLANLSKASLTFSSIALYSSSQAGVCSANSLARNSRMPQQSSISLMSSNSLMSLLQLAILRAHSASRPFSFWSSLGWKYMSMLSLTFWLSRLRKSVIFCRSRLKALPRSDQTWQRSRTSRSCKAFSDSIISVPTQLDTTACFSPMIRNSCGCFVDAATSRYCLISRCVIRIFSGVGASQVSSRLLNWSTMLALAFSMQRSKSTISFWQWSSEWSCDSMYFDSAFFQAVTLAIYWSRSEIALSYSAFAFSRSASFSSPACLRRPFSWFRVDKALANSWFLASIVCSRPTFSSAQLPRYSSFSRSQVCTSKALSESSFSLSYAFYFYRRETMRPFSEVKLATSSYFSLSPLSLSSRSQLQCLRSRFLSWDQAYCLAYFQRASDLTKSLLFSFCISSISFCLSFSKPDFSSVISRSATRFNSCSCNSSLLRSYSFSFARTSCLARDSPSNFSASLEDQIQKFFLRSASCLAWSRWAVLRSQSQRYFTLNFSISKFFISSSFEAFYSSSSFALLENTSRSCLDLYTSSISFFNSAFLMRTYQLEASVPLSAVVVSGRFSSLFSLTEGCSSVFLSAHSGHSLPRVTRVHTAQSLQLCLMHLVVKISYF